VITSARPAGGLQPPRLCWKRSIASCRQGKRFLQCIEDNFLSQVIEGPTGGCNSGPVIHQCKWTSGLEAAWAVMTILWLSSE